LKAVLALNLTSMGIPCIYYGTEQGFDGAGESDRFLRECMFGGAFGSLQSKDRHFFNEQHEIYRFLVDVLALRSKYLPLRRGRQYLREISDSGAPGTFGIPRMIGGQIRSVVPWSRLFANQEILLAINTDADHSRSTWVTIDNYLHSDLTGPAGRLTCLYSTDPAQIGTTTLVEARNGRSVYFTVPPAGFVIFA
jgi:glycosidase